MNEYKPLPKHLQTEFLQLLHPPEYLQIIEEDLSVKILQPKQNYTKNKTPNLGNMLFAAKRYTCFLG
jgi:hypothetical protein